MKSKALNRYKYGTYRGKKIPQREIQRRVAQSLGYKMSIHDMPPSWFALMARGGITFDNLFDYEEQDTVFTDEKVETKTLTL